MHLTYCRDYEEMSRQAAAVVLREIEQKKDLLLCAATGNSPAGLYAQLAAKARHEKAFFERLRVIKLDEWGGLSENDPAGGEHYLRHRLLDPLAVTPDRYLGFRSDAVEPAAECARIGEALAQHGPVDVCILGLGANGHLGFNEPAAFLQLHCHVAGLSATSQAHAMVAALPDKPTYGLTLGMADLLHSRKIILLVWGNNKEKTIQALLSRQITTGLPASLLWLHPNVVCFMGREA
jgi:galactosamine-6-phosphate isomerase